MPDEFGDRLRKLEDQIVVNATLVNRLEQRVDRLEQEAREHGNGIAELRAFQTTVFGLLDRIARGLESNGRKN